MKIPEEQYYELIDRVVHEGEPELLLGPIERLADEIPSTWLTVLTAQDSRTAIASLWGAIEERLPRICLAIQERLQGIGFLCTEEVPASLIYFFSVEGNQFQYRGRHSKTDASLAKLPFQTEFLDFYRIHDGWTLFFSEDNGPVSSVEWQPLSDVWANVNFKLLPRGVSLNALIVVFRDGDELALAYDTSSLTMIPVLCLNDGTIEPLLDIWLAIDDHIGELLEELDSAPIAGAGGFKTTDKNLKIEQRLEVLREKINEPQLEYWLPRSVWHQQACDIFLQSAWIEKQKQNSRDKVIEYCNQALQQWCMSVEKGGQSYPDDVLSMFALSLSLQDQPTAGFIATLSKLTWMDNSLEAFQIYVLLDLFLGDFRLIESNMEEVLGLTFDEEQSVTPLAEAITQLLKSLHEMNHSSFIEWRQQAIVAFGADCIGKKERIPWQIKLSAFDVIASRLGLTK